MISTSSNFKNLISIYSFLGAVSLRIFKPWLHPEFVYQRTKIYREEQEALKNTALKFSADISSNILKKMKNSLNAEEQKSKSKSFMKDLFQSNLSETEINDEIRTLLVAVSYL